MSARSSRRAAALLALGAALLAGGCGSSGEATQADLRLQREDLIAAARGLSEAQGQVAGEVKAAKAAWPAVANGLPATPAPAVRTALAEARRRATALRVPPLFDEQRAARLTGPGASLAGTFRNFTGLSTTGWKMVEYALAAKSAGGPAASFATANSPLYVEAVYDGHFGLARIGKALRAGYDKLGGPAAFGSALTQAEVDRLAGAYSEEAAQLHPHPGVKLGS